MFSFVQASCLLSLIGSVYSAGGSGWSYAGQGNYWPVQEPACGGERQSPINIDTSKVYNEYTDNNLEFTKYSKELSGKFSNPGASLQFTPDSDANLPGVYNGSLVGDKFKLLQFHFHWGSSNDRGSEHTIDGNRFAMEMHLVHIKKQYLGDTDAALASPDGLSVVGIMFVVGQNGSDFAPLQPMVDAALEMADDQSAEVDADINLKDFVNEVGPCYYTYYGSLTTPTCNEVVSWFMMDGTIAISQEQLDAFKGLEYDDGAPIVDNFRPPQPLNNRIVKRVVPMDY